MVGTARNSTTPSSRSVASSARSTTIVRPGTSQTTWAVRRCGLNRAGCEARNAAGVSTLCFSAHPNIVAAAQAVGPDSYIGFNRNASGNCTALYVAGNSVNSVKPPDRRALRPQPQRLAQSTSAPLVKLRIAPVIAPARGEAAYTAAAAMSSSVGNRFSGVLAAAARIISSRSMPAASACG